MTITLSKRIVERSEIEIPVPSFWINQGGRLMAIINEENVIVLYKRDNYTNIVSGTADMMKTWTEEIHEFLPIHESQFFDAHEEALESLSLSPKLTHKNYVADLESIGVKRKEA